jgi:hypothetical protein
MMDNGQFQTLRLLAGPPKGIGRSPVFAQRRIVVATADAVYFLQRVFSFKSSEK